MDGVDGRSDYIQVPIVRLPPFERSLRARSKPCYYKSIVTNELK
jgi:hypothetical protein